jgi:hypothetical protein
MGVLEEVQVHQVEQRLEMLERMVWGEAEAELLVRQVQLLLMEEEEEMVSLSVAISHQQERGQVHIRLWQRSILLRVW